MNIRGPGRSPCVKYGGRWVLVCPAVFKTVCGRLKTCRMSSILIHPRQKKGSAAARLSRRTPALFVAEAYDILWKTGDSCRKMLSPTRMA